MKILYTLIIVASLTGCIPPKIERVYVPKYVPVITVPAPPIVERKPSEINGLTPEQLHNDGIYAKALVVDNERNEAYIQKLERVIAKYRELSGKGDDLPEIPDNVKNDPSWFSKYWNELFNINSDMDKLEKEINDN